MEQPKHQQSAATESVPLFPVKKVVLSKTGIGYFEREDDVSGGRPFELYFKSGDMNDVLKSLAMVDLSGKTEAKAKVSAEFSFGKNSTQSSSEISAIAGGQPTLVSSISYESTKPFEKQLDDLSVSFNEHSSLRDLLAQVKGTPVAVEVIRQGKRLTVEGTVVGLETKTLTRPSYHTAHFLALLVGGQSLQYFNLGAVVRLRFVNELMQQDLRHLLSILLQAKKKDLKSVTGYTRGSGEQRTIRASYIVEAPVWKTTYRLLFYSPSAAADSKAKDDAAAAAKPKSILEGWALVDNTQNEDWRGVELSLVSGASNSFIYDLYNPRYAARTEIEVEQEETLAPPTLEDAVAQHDVSALTEATALRDERAAAPVRRARAKKEMAAPMMSRMGGPPPPPMAACAPPPPMMMMARASSSSYADECEEEYGSDPFSSYGGAPPPPPEEFSRSAASGSVEVNSEAKKMEMADLFQYRITSAVNVLRNQSALVPFLHTPFDGVKASIYNKNVREDNPLAVIKFKNTYGVPLEGGPLSLFEDDVYVGEAMLPRVKVNEELYVAYAVDLKTSVTMTESSHLREPYQADVARYEWEQGTLYVRRWFVYEFTYVIDNKNDRAIEHFYLEHPKKASVLIETPEPDERLDHFYRFKLSVPARQVVKFVVKEQESRDETYSLESITRSQLEAWIAADYLPADAKKTLETMVSKNEKKLELSGVLSRVRTHIRSLKEDVTRIDSCLGALALSQSGFYSEQSKFRDYFTKQLNEAKAELQKMEKEEERLVKKVDKLNSRVYSLSRTVKFIKPLNASTTTTAGSSISSAASTLLKKGKKGGK